MVWKQDLAKLKQQFKEVEEPKTKVPVPKPVPRLAPPGTIEEEDALFLNAMGRRTVLTAPPKEKSLLPIESKPLVAQEVPPAEDFQAAMGGLKGLKPMQDRVPAASPQPPVALPSAAVGAESPTVSEPAPEACPPKPSVSDPLPQEKTKGPTLIHLAAGMAIEVDGSLDLKGHTTVDAMERIRERLQDGVFLGWRTFHVTLGPSDDLREAFLALLERPEAQAITRYAQAPIPMGGNQAWILYYAGPATH